MVNIIKDFIRELNKDGIDKLILLGYSAGATTLSHVSSNIKDLHIKTNILAYNSSYSNAKTLRYLNKNIKFIDRDVSKNIIKIFNNNLENTTCDYYTAMTYLMNNYNLTLKELFKICSFNFDQNPETNVINIINKYDIITDPKYVKYSIEKYKSKINFPIYNIVRNKIDHCTDMLFNTKYLKDLLYAINL